MCYHNIQTPQWHPRGTFLFLVIHLTYLSLETMPFLPLDFSNTVLESNKIFFCHSSYSCHPSYITTSLFEKERLSEKGHISISQTSCRESERIWFRKKKKRLAVVLLCHQKPLLVQNVIAMFLSLWYSVFTAFFLPQKSSTSPR